MRYKFVKLYMLSLFLVFCASSAFSVTQNIIINPTKIIPALKNRVCSCQEWKKWNSLGYADVCGYGDFCSKSKNYYVGIRGILNFVNHGYYADGGETESTVDFGQSLGGELSFGIALEKNWWLQFDLGHIGTYTDKESFSEVSGLEFRESVDYFVVNGVYMTSSGFYVGPGIGIAAHKTGLNAVGWQEEYSFSPMGQVMIGLEYKIAEDWAIDFGARMSAFYGTDQEFTGLSGISIGTGLVWNFAVTMGIKYKF